MRPILGPSRQTIGFPTEDGSNKSSNNVQGPALPTESQERSQASKNNSIAEARLQGDFRAAELNAAYQHNQTNLDFKEEVSGLEPFVKSDEHGFFLPEVNDEVLIKKDLK
jgi:hypothetical protein